MIHLRARLGLLWMLAAVLVTTMLVTDLGRAPAGAAPAPVPKSVCARYDQGIRDGVCVQDRHGGVYWLGTIKGYDGVEMYCIDFYFATSWGVAHRRVRLSGPLPTSVGRTVRASTTAALTYVATRYPASTADDTTAAAIGLIIRQVMGDVRRPYGQMIPGGLAVGTDVRDVAFVPDRVVSRARQLWREAREHRGPWKVQVKVAPGAEGRVSPGERVVATVRGTNGSATAQDMTVALAYGGFTGPRTVRLGRDGVGAITLTAPPSPTTATVTARVANAPSPAPILVRPTRWQTNPRPGYPSLVSQRGLLGQQAAVLAADRVVVEVHYGPRVVTRTSDVEVTPGAVITDEVVITGADPAYTGPVTATLHGPFPKPPGLADCASGPVAGTVTFPVRGDGTYRTPGVKLSTVGYYTWVEVLPATPSQDAVRTPCGLVEETTVARSSPRIVTQTSAAVVEVGRSITDRVIVSGATPGYTATATAYLYGPYPDLTSATCAGRPYATVQFPVTGNGTYVTPPVRLRAAGVFTWVEELPGDGFTRPARTACGVVSETTLARRTPPVPDRPSVPAGATSRGAR